MKGLEERIPLVYCQENGSKGADLKEVYKIEFNRILGLTDLRDKVGKVKS